jgi:hypothetical protein
MAFYEVIYEDSTYSVAQYADDDEAVLAVGAHHERAKAGGPALESSPEVGKAVRVVKLFRYERDPGSATEDQALSEDVAKKEVEDALKNSTHDGVTDLRELSARIRDISNPLVVSGPHESNYKADGKEVKLPWAKED